MMAFATKRETKGHKKQVVLAPLTSYVFFPQQVEGNNVMVSVQVNRLALLATLAAVLATVIIALEYSGSPSLVELGLSQYFVLLGYATLPVSCIFTRSLASSSNLSNQKFSGLGVMASNELGNADASAVHVGLNWNRLTTATLAGMFALVLLNPLVNASVIGSTVVSSIGFANRPTHASHGIKFNRGLQCKSDELLETPPTQVEGNQQPSQKYTSGRFRDYRSGEVRLITGKSVRRESDDIVHARRNTGSRVNGLKFNSATLIKSRYCPGSDIATVGSQSNVIAVTMLKTMSAGAITAYPTLAVSSSETLFWINARKPFIYFYVSDDPEFGFGFTGFKPAQGNTKVAGQCLAAVNMTVPGPRYHQQIYGITG